MYLYKVSVIIMTHIVYDKEYSCTTTNLFRNILELQFNCKQFNVT